MKVLMISEKDAANASLGKIASSFLKNKSEIILFATYFDDTVLHYFDEAIPRFKIEDISESQIAWCDIIVCSTLVSTYIPAAVFFARKPIFTHNYLMNRQINWGGDICFAPSQATVASDYDCYLNYSYISIGEPKYDSQKNIENASTKRFLFIDSGHYPFSYQGKCELAKTLIGICNKYPDYDMVIKPRFLPGDKVVTHRNSIHLYDIIRKEANGEIPNNMIMLDVHEDLQKLIEECSTVICMYTTAFVGAIVSGKGLIVLENFKSTDIYDIRQKTFMRNRENIIPSGALVDYNQVDKLLPNGARGDEAYLDFLLEEKENVADKIAETCEYLWRNFYSLDKFPKRCDSNYKKYKNYYKVDNNMTWEKHISMRCYDYILFKSIILIDFRINAKIDIDYILKKVDSCKDENGLINYDTFISFLNSINEIRDNCIIKNRDVLLKDDIDAGILLNAYYLQKKYNEIRLFPLKHISAFDMYRAFVAFDTHEPVTIARDYLIKYFDKCINREFNLEISDMTNNKFKSFKLLIDILILENDVKLVKFYYEKLKNYYLQEYGLNNIEELPNDIEQISRLNYINQIGIWVTNNE